MSKRRSIILSVTVQGISQAEAARLYEVSEATVSRLMARWRTHGDEAFEPRSRRPRRSPSRVTDVLNETIVNLRVELLEAGLDAGAETIRWHLQQHHNANVSTSTIRRRLIAAGLIEPAPRKRPKSSYVRFQADLPNECWQSDFTHCRLADGTDCEVIVWIDDHSRYALSVTAYRRITGDLVVDTFTQIAETNGFPASVLTDNGLVYTTRLAGGRGGRNRLETLLESLGIEQKHSRPNHPTTCGKVERFHQTMKKWLDAHPRPGTIATLQELIDDFVDEYNHRRPHRSLDRRTPTVVYALLPKSTPAGSDAGTHHRNHH